MTGLEGAVSTPFGPVQKKTGLLVAGIAVVVLGYSYYRAKKQSAVAASGANTGVDPATGYTYGSPEDAAALAAQSSYISPAGGSGSGSGGANIPTGGGFPSNQAWSQAVIQYLQSNGILVDSSAMATALGRYLAGEPVADDQHALINQAIAVEGYPPISGVNGYPPSINTAAVTTPPPGGGGGTTPPPKNVYPDKFGTVLAGWHVDEWILDMRAQGRVPPTWGWTELSAHNPGISNNVVWHAGHSELNTFKKQATYTLY